MSTFSQRVKHFKDLPKTKSNLDKLSFQIESLDKIKSTLSNDNYQLLNKNYSKQLSELETKKADLENGITKLIAEIEIDIKMLENSTSILRKNYRIVNLCMSVTQ